MTILEQRIKIIETEQTKLKELFEHIYPYENKRTKRGIINGLGTIIKSITGNLDNDDFIEISKALELVKLNQNKVTGNTNEQIIINNKMIKRFDEIQNYINNITEQVRIQLLDMESTIQHGKTYIEMESILYTLEHNIREIKDQLLDIDNIITFSKLNLISKKVLNKEELNYVKEQFEKNEINILAEEDIYDFLGIQAYYNHTNIILSIQIPTFFKEQFKYYKLKTIPINQTYILPLLTEDILINDKKYMYNDKPNKIIENTIYCENNKIKQIQQECIPNIINSKDAKCKAVEEEFKEELTELPNGQIYISTKYAATIFTTCSYNGKNKISGLKLITINNCKIAINDTIINREYKQFKQEIPTINIYGDTIITKKINKIHLDKLHNSSLQYEKEIELLKIKHQYHNIQGHTTSTILIIIIILIVIFFLFKRYKIDLSKINVNIPSPAPSKKFSFWPSLRGEELRHTNDFTTTTTTNNPVKSTSTL